MFTFFPITTNAASGRVKHTAIASSAHFLVVGVTTGSVYILDSDNFVTQHIFTFLKEGVTKLAISNDERYLAMTSKSEIYVIDVINKKTLMKITDVKSEITALCWGLIYLLISNYYFIIYY